MKRALMSISLFNDTLFSTGLFLYFLLLFKSTDWSPQENTDREDLFLFLLRWLYLLLNTDGGFHDCFEVIPTPTWPRSAPTPMADCARDGASSPTLGAAAPTADWGLNALFTPRFGTFLFSLFCSFTLIVWKAVGLLGIFANEAIPDESFLVSALEMACEDGKGGYLVFGGGAYGVSIGMISGGLISLETLSSLCVSLPALNSSSSIAFNEL